MQMSLPADKMLSAASVAAAVAADELIGNQQET